MWPCCTRVVAGASYRSERQSAETPERRRAGRGQSCTPREAAPRPSVPAVRRARGAGTPRTSTPRRESHGVVPRRLSHCRPHTPLLPDRAHRRAPAGRGGPGRGTPRPLPLPARPIAQKSGPTPAPRPRGRAPPESELNCFEFPVIIYVLNGPARHTQRVT